MAKILVADDDTELRNVLSDWLSSENHAVDLAADGKEAEYLLSMFEYEVAVLDWEMPEVSGVELCKKIRSKQLSTAVIMLTGRRAFEDRISGLDSGADDYLTKPFDLGELSARIRALMRRPSTPASSMLKARDLVLDTDSKVLKRNDKVIDLQPKELALLEFFMRHPGKVFSAEAIVDRVWPSSSEASVDVVKVNINRLRKKIDLEGSESYIKTVHGLGYKLDS